MLRPPLQKRFTKCRNLFKTPKRNVKGGQNILLQFATKLVDHGYKCIPGWQFVEHVMTLHIDSNQARKQPNERLNQGLHSFEDQMTQHWRVM